MTGSRRGLLVAIEGIDGTGKTTLQHALARLWRSQGLPVVEMREPSSGPSGRRARRASERDPWTAAMAFTDDRRLQRSRVERALGRGRVILLDRSFYSTLAYQGSALPPARRRELEQAQLEATIVPDRVVLLDLPLAVARDRMERRGTAKDPTEHHEVLRRAARTYRQLARRHHWIVLDARREARTLLGETDRRLTGWARRRTATAREPA
jgi:dTMP kinase